MNGPQSTISPSAESPASGGSPADHFLPIRLADLVDLLATQPDLLPGDRQRLIELARLLAATLHYDYHQQLSSLKADYAPFDPDSDTITLLPFSTEERETRLGNLFNRLAWLLERANFTRLSRETIEQATVSHSQWGLDLDVDFDVFDRLELFVRGEAIGEKPRRGMTRWFHKEPVTVELYQRLVVLLKLRPGSHTPKSVDTQDVYLKLFKDIPRLDLEMLLPGTRVKMSLVDRTKIVLPTLSGLVLTCWKLISGALVVAAAGATNLVALLGLVGGSLGYGLRSFHGYLQTKQRYQLSLTESLYYQNLDNNAGVLMRLVDEAEEQENREALLGWFFLWRTAPRALSATELDQQVEAFLKSKLGRSVDFEVGDALDKLLRWHLVEQCSSNRFRAVSLEQALTALDTSWDRLFDYSRAA